MLLLLALAAPAALVLAHDVPTTSNPSEVAANLVLPRYPLPEIGVNLPPTDPDAAPTPTVDAVVVAPTLSSTLATSPAAAAATDSPYDDNPGECRLLGPFAILVQLALGGLALLSLVYKRWRERPQRPVKIWFFDASKQVFGSVLVHIANVFMSMLTSGRLSIRPPMLHIAGRAVESVLLRRADDAGPNPCSFYLLNLGIDTTLGIPILIFLVRLTTKVVGLTSFGQPPESIQSGNYGSPPNAWWWLKQSLIYFCGLMGMKICVLIIFMMMPWISLVGDWALRWTEGNERVQIVFVMMLFPLIMNAMQYYIIDSFIKAKDVPVQDEQGLYDGLSATESSEDDVSDDDDDENGEPSRIVHMMKTDGPADREYDPVTDGESRTVVGSSSSSKPGSRGVMAKELLPGE